jgi:hypothetical protein
MHLWNEIVVGRKISINEHRCLLYVNFISKLWSIMLLHEVMKYCQPFTVFFQAEKITPIWQHRYLPGTSMAFLPSDGYSMEQETTGRSYLSFSMSTGYGIKILYCYYNPECIGYVTKCLRISALRTHVLLSTQTSKAQDMHRYFGWYQRTLLSAEQTRRT